MLKKSTSFVLAALGGSTYRKEYASLPLLLWPRWMAFLNNLRGVLIPPRIFYSFVLPQSQNGF